MEPARQRDLRDRNLAAVLRAVARSAEPISRAALAASIGLTRATVSALVEPLLDAELLTEVDPVPRAGAGRPAAGLELSGGRVAALGAEIGVDYLAVTVRDLTGVVRVREVVREDHRGRPAEVAVGRSAALAARALDRAAGEGLDVVGASWAVPGLVDAARRRVMLAPNLGWQGVPVVDLLVERAPQLASLAASGVLELENEAALCAVAEIGHPVPAAPHGLLVVSGEVGIGAGLVLDGRLARGERGWSGEIGHVAVSLDGPLCGCGARGCLEVYAGQEAVLRAAGRDTAPGTAHGSGAGSAGGVLVELARSADPSVLAALDVAGRALGAAVAGAVNLLDVDEVVLGGVYGPLGRWLLPLVRAQVDARVLRARLRPVLVRTSTLGPDAAVLGAAAAVLQGVLDHPAGLLDRR